MSAQRPVQPFHLQAYALELPGRMSAKAPPVQTVATVLELGLTVRIDYFFVPVCGSV